MIRDKIAERSHLGFNMVCCLFSIQLPTCTTHN
jgi:hypothetical protein